MDSSLQDRKAPGNVTLTHPAAPPVQCNAEAKPPPVLPGGAPSLALRDAAVRRSGGLRELLRKPLDPLRRRVEGRHHGILRRLRAHIIGGAGVLQSSALGFG